MKFMIPVLIAAFVAALAPEGSAAGRPAAWCGWYMRSQVGSDPGPEYNLARTWALA